MFLVYKRCSNNLPFEVYLTRRLDNIRWKMCNCNREKNWDGKGGFQQDECCF